MSSPAKDAPPSTLKLVSPAVGRSGVVVDGGENPFEKPTPLFISFGSENCAVSTRSTA